MRRLSSRLTRSLQRNAGLTASLLAAPREPGKKQETPDSANLLEKKPGKLEA
jgi:hypothetical protein